MPFIETALIGVGEEDNIIHFGGVRYRVDGTGQLLTTMFGYNKITNSTLLPLTMVALATRELTRLANFKSQKALVRISTNEIDEVFQFNKILVYVKELYVTFPGQ